MMRCRNFRPAGVNLFSSYGALNYHKSYLELSIDSGEMKTIKMLAPKVNSIILENIIKKYCELGEQSYKTFNPEIFIFLLTELRAKTQKKLDQLLIKSNITSEQKNDLNARMYPLLLIAAWHGQATIVQLLIDAGADPFLKNAATGLDPLSAAQLNKQNAVISLLQPYYDLDMFINALIDSLSKLPKTSSYSLFGYGLTAKNLALKEITERKLKKVLAQRPLNLKEIQENVVLILNEYQTALSTNNSIRYLTQLEDFLCIGKLSTIKQILLEHLDISLAKLKIGVGKAEKNEIKL